MLKPDCDKSPVTYLISTWHIIAGLLVLALVAGALTSCGDSVSTDTGDRAPDPSFPMSSTVVSVERPQQGTVKANDALNDIIEKTGGQIVPYPWIDIASVSIVPREAGYKIIVDLAGDLPKSLIEGTVGFQWAVNIDTDNDGQRDWAITAALTESGWTSVLHNVKTKESLADARFPGSFIHPARSIEWEIRGDAIGSPTTFKWSALAEERDPRNVNENLAIDVLPQDGYPLGEGWLDYP